MILKERLTINGQEVAVAGYSLKAPTNGLGQSLTIALVDPLLSGVPEDATFTFEIGAGLADSNGATTYSWVTVLSNGRLNGLNYSAAWLDSPEGGSPNDLIEFTAMSPLADRLNLAPAAPIIMFDPNKVEGNKLVPEESQLIRKRDGYGNYVPLFPVLESRPGLNLHQILERAYTAIGFSSVVNNLPNFTVERVDFTLESGYHSPASSLYSLFEPVVFEDSNRMYIISPEYGLPPGFTPTELDARCVIELRRNQETAALVNSIIMSYSIDASGQTGTGGELPSIEVIYETPVESGEGESYVRTETSREITTFRDLVSGAIRRIQENWINTKTYAYRPLRTIAINGDGEVEVTYNPHGGGVVLISEERIANTYANKTKSGHFRYMDALYPNPDGAGAPDVYGRVFTETASFTWRPDLSHPGEYELVSSRLYAYGLCLIENISIEEEFPPTGQTVKYTHKVYTPILDAMETGLITGDGTQGLTERPLYTVMETLRETGQNQSDVDTRIVNHLTGGNRPPAIMSRPGSRSTFVPPLSIRFGGGVKAGTFREQIVNQESIDLFGLRKSITLDIGKINPAEGRRIVERRLQMSAKPPRLFDITLPGINFYYRRGVIIIPPLRSGFDNPAIITGTEITGRGLHTAAALREMRIDARELFISE